MDSQNEQDNNLKDILGYDPDDSPSSSSSKEISRSNKQPSKLEMAAKAGNLSVEELRSKFLEEMLVRGRKYKDPDNLFTINTDSWLGGVEREYFKYNPDPSVGLSSFRTGVEIKIASVVDDSPYSYLWRVGYHGEQHDMESIHLRNNRSVNLYKYISGDRIVNVDYSNAGKLVKVNFGIYAGDGEYGLRFGKDGKNMEDYVDYNKWSDYLSEDMQPIRHLKPPDIEFGIDENGMYNIVMTREGQETDRFHIPEEIDIEELSGEMMPQQLLRNPESHDLSLDQGALSKTPFARIGASWEVFDERRSE